LYSPFLPLRFYSFPAILNARNFPSRALKIPSANTLYSLISTFLNFLKAPFKALRMRVEGEGNGGALRLIEKTFLFF